MAKNQINKVESNQLAVFDYSELDGNIAKLAKESAIEIKAREKAIWENIIEIGNRLIQVKNALNDYRNFESWVKLEFNWTRQHSNRYIKIAQELNGNIDVPKFNLPMTALYQLASSFSDSDEETKEQIITAVEQKTEDKGKALTEKEIKEITAKIKAEYEEKFLNFEETFKQERTQRVASLVGEINQLKGRIEYFEDIEETYSNSVESKKEEINLLQKQLSHQETMLQKYQSEKDELDEHIKNYTKLSRQYEKAIKENGELFDKEVNEKVKLKLAQERADLKEKEDKVIKELANAKKLTKENQQLNKQLTDLTTWIDTLESFVFNISDNITQINRVINNLDKLPPVEALAPDEQKLFRPKLVVLSERFDEAQYKYGSAINSIHSKLKELNLNSFNQIIDVKAKGVK